MNILGGRGFGDNILFKELDKDTHPLSKDNLMIFATGCLTATSFPGSSRIQLVSKNAINNGILFSSGGGNFGAELKQTGLDAIVVEGKSSKPIYIFINNGRIEFKDALHLWGKTTWETNQIIRQELGSDTIETACIGPAGENQVLVSCIIIDKAHALAWGGSGAIMGSKNLKAIAVKGDKPVKIHNPHKFAIEIDKYKWILLSTTTSHALKEHGTHGIAGAGRLTGNTPTSVRNLQTEYWDPAKTAKLKEQAYKRFEISRTNCFNCPLYCLHLYKMTDNDECLISEGMHANSVRGFGSNWDIDDPFAVLKAHTLCNQLGLDVDGVSSVVAWAMECFECGLISNNDTYGLNLRWGNAGHLLKLIEDIAFKRGFGKILVEGVYKASKIIGKQSLKHAVHIKKIGLNEQGLRSHKAWAFGMAVSTRGSGHLGGSPQTENIQIPKHVSKWLFGIEEAGVPGSYDDKEKLVVWYEIYKALIDSLGICYFNTGWYSIVLANLNILSTIYAALTGVDLNKQGLHNIGKHIINVEKAFNVIHAGFTRNDDILPLRVMDKPLTEGPYKGEFFRRQKFDDMLTNYYKLHGWDSKTGLQKKEVLVEL